MPDAPKGVLRYDELPDHAKAAVRRQLGRKRVSRGRDFTAEHERRFALRVLALIADLTQMQRYRVPKRALRVNDV